MTNRYSLRAGTCPVTPARRGPLAGYAARGDAVSAGIHDDLEVAIVWLSDSAGGSVLWLTIDAIGVTVALHDELVAAVRSAAGDPVLFVVTCASHTHSAPLGWTGGINPGTPGPRSAAAVDELVESVSRLVSVLALAPQEPVVLNWGMGDVDGVGTNRLSADGPHDRSVGVLSARRVSDGALLGVVVDFATHPTVLPASNLCVSADWPGAMRHALRTALAAVGNFAGSAAPSPVIAFLQGAAGDVSTRFTRTGQDFSEAARLGAILAGSVLELVSAPGERVHGGITARDSVIELPRRTLPDAAAAATALAEADAALAAASGSPHDPGIRQLQTRVDGARVQSALVDASLPVAFVLPVELVVIGTVAWVCVPLELFASLGERIRGSSPFAHTRVVGYASGYFGYLADRIAHDGASYEAMSSYFDAVAGDRFVEAVVALMHQFDPTVTQKGSA